MSQLLQDAWALVALMSKQVDKEETDRLARRTRQDNMDWGNPHLNAYMRVIRTRERINSDKFRSESLKGKYDESIVRLSLIMKYPSEPEFFQEEKYDFPDDPNADWD